MIYMVVVVSLTLPLETTFDAFGFCDNFKSQQTYFSEARISARLPNVQQLQGNIYWYTIAILQV